MRCQRRKQLRCTHLCPPAHAQMSRSSSPASSSSPSKQYRQSSSSTGSTSAMVRPKVVALAQTLTCFTREIEKYRFDVWSQAHTSLAPLDSSARRPSSAMGIDDAAVGVIIEARTRASVCSATPAMGTSAGRSPSPFKTFLRGDPRAGPAVLQLARLLRARAVRLERLRLAHRAGGAHQGARPLPPRAPSARALRPLPAYCAERDIPLHAQGFTLKYRTDIRRAGVRVIVHHRRRPAVPDEALRRARAAG